MMPSEDRYELPGDDTPIAQAAEMYARLGFAVVPVYGLTPGGQCACGNAECSAPGKHPCGGSWQKRATSDVDAVRDLFRGHVGNIGIVPGSALVVLDVDGYHGGYEGLLDLGEMPETLTSRSGSGQGEHRIYAYGPGQDAREVTNRRVAEGVDVKTRLGQIVVAPSRHVSGGQYAWTVRVPPATLPDELFTRIRKAQHAAVVPIHSSPNSDLRKRAGAYAARLDPAIAGAGGHMATFAAARAIMGWVIKGLPEADGWALLCEYNARCQPPWSERDLAHKWSDAHNATSLPSLEDRQSAPATAATAPVDWKAHLVWTKSRSGPDKPAKHHENAIVVLRYHPLWAGKVRLDTHAQRVTVSDPPWHESNRPADAATVRDWTDSDSVRLSSWIRREVMGLELSVSDMDRAVSVVAESNTHHPFRDYLGSIRWDGKPRLGHWLITYLGAPASPYAELVARWWVIAAVARTYDPGCKADHVLILEGPQGIKKSTALRTLAGDAWFTDTPIDIGNKDAYLSIQGRVIVELAELDSLKRADADRAKSFFSSAVDVYRPPYARRNISVPRGCVFAGTVNHAAYLQDDTGNRRYWPVRCTRIDLDALARDRDQLWAEAVSLYFDGAVWWPDSLDEAALCETEQAPRLQSDAWEEPVATWLRLHPDTTTAEILSGPLQIEVGKWTRADQMRVGRILGQLGAERYRSRQGVVLSWRYRVPTFSSGTEPE